MECQAWSQEFESLAAALQLGPWMQDCLSVRGANALQAPLVVPQGAQEVPTLRGNYEDEDTRTGFYFPPGAVGLTIRGWAKFQWTCSGMRFLDSGFYAELGTQDLTANRNLQLPDQSGILAIQDVFSRLNGEATSIQAGQPVALNSGILCLWASAQDHDLRAIGLAVETRASGAAVNIRPNGIHEQQDWTAVIGSSALTVDAEYYLGHLPGTLTVNPTDLPGYLWQYIGRAISGQKLLLQIKKPILL